MGANPRQVGITDEQWKSYQSTPLTVGNRSGGNPFAIFGSGMRAQSRGGSHYQGGMVGFEEGGAIPDPDETLYARGGGVANRDEKFQQFLRQESRPGRSVQDARDAAAKRLSAFEGRPTSSAYRPGRAAGPDPDYWQPTKPRKGDAKTDTTKTSSTGATRVIHPPNPRMGRRQAATGYTYPERTGTAAQQAIDRAGPPPRVPEPVYPEDRAEREPRMPDEEGGWRKRRVTRPAEAPAAAFRTEPNPDRFGPVVPPRPRIAMPDTTLPPGSNMANPPGAPAAAPVAEPQLGAWINGQWVPFSYPQYQRGGAVDELDMDRLRPLTQSPRAESAGYTTSAAGAMAPAPAPARPQPSAAPAIPETAGEAGMTAPGEAEPERPKANVKPTPRLLDDVAKALDGGVKFLTRHFGLQGDGALQTPEDARNADNGAQRFASGEGAMTGEELQAIDDRVDPDRQLSESDRQMTRLAKMTQWYLQQGRKEDAAAAAAGLMQYGAQRSAKLGSLAAAAYRKYQQSGNPQDLENTTKFLQSAYEMVPDGGTFNISIDPKTQRIMYDKDGPEGPEPAQALDPNMLPQIIQGAQNKSLYWDSIFRLADPEGARARDTRASDEFKHQRTLEEEEQKNTRETREEAERNKREEEEFYRRRDEERKYKEAHPTGEDKTVDEPAFQSSLADAGAARDALNTAKQASEDPSTDPEVQRLRQEYNFAVSRLADTIPFDRRSLELQRLGFEGFTYMRPDGSTSAQPAQPATEAQPSPSAQPSPKDKFPDAYQKPDGSWYVMRDGKEYKLKPKAR